MKINEKLDASLKRNIIISNIIFLNIAICCLVVAIMCVFDQPAVSLVYGLITVVSLFCIVLNYFQHYILSRVIFLLVLNVGIFFTVILTDSSIAYAGDRLFILVNILLAGVLFNIKEKGLVIGSFILTIILLLAFDFLREQLQLLMAFKTYPAISIVGYTMKFALAGVTVSLCIYYFQSITNKAEDKNKQSLIEKEILLKEVHHRVKNNLQIISSLLSLQSNYLEDEASKKSFINTQNRIKAIAVVHEKLYKSKDVQNVNLVEYITSIIDLVASSFGNDSTKVVYSFPDFFSEKFSINKAIPCGLIVNEIITNAYKHAFSEIEEGIINIKLIKVKEKCKMIIEDNGVGFPNGFDYRESNSLGFELIESLVEQLEGSMIVETGKGVKFIIEFPYFSIS